METYRNHVMAWPLPPCRTARFEVDVQPGYPDGRTVSLNLELFDKDGEWIDNETAEFRGFKPGEEAQAEAYSQRLNKLAGALNRMLAMP